MYYEMITENKFDYRLKWIEKFDPDVFDGIKAITYDGLNYENKKTKIFAYIGFPKGDGPFPAVVLLHGGGGHAYPHWIKLWNECGFAAIAMDNTGFYPAEDGHESEWSEEKEKIYKKKWQHKIHKSLEEDGYTAMPDNDCMKTSEQAVDRQWMFHAVGATIIANNILRDDPRVIKEKIGICGISWGGVIASVTIGFDNRYAFAIPIYGSGYLNEGMGWMSNYFGSDMKNSNWRAENRFKNTHMPILWQCWNDDSAFSINANSRSYSATLKNNRKTLLSIVDNMDHGHLAAWKRDEPLFFAECICGDSRSMPKISKDGKIDYENMECISARLFYTKTPYKYHLCKKNGEEELPYMDGEWETAEAHIENGKLTAPIPESICAYYYEILLKKDGKSIVFSTPLKKNDSIKMEN